MKPYYTLAVRENGAWAPQAGALTRAEIESEARYIRHANGDLVKGADKRILKSEPDNDAILAAVAELNASEQRAIARRAALIEQFRRGVGP
jgi:hypothetical protein